MAAAVAAASRSSSSNSRRSKLELTWMSMLGDRLGSTVGDRHVVRRQEPRQDVVAIGTNDQPRHRQPHATRHPGGEHIAEIAGRHAERHLAIRRAQRQRRGDVIRNLRGDPRPVDRVHRREMHLLAERRVGEHRLHQVLAVVERALDRDVGDVRRGNRGHLPALHLADAVVRVQERDVDAVAAGACLDRGRAGIARGGADDRHARIARPPARGRTGGRAAAAPCP